VLGNDTRTVLSGASDGNGNSIEDDLLGDFNNLCGKRNERSLDDTLTQRFGDMHADPPVPTSVFVGCAVRTDENGA
jgi:hypothetical protein